MTSGRMGKKLFRKLHLWLSVPFGILIALICFSGAMLVFEDEVTQWAKPHLYRVSEPSGTRISTEEAAALVAATLPEGVGVRGVKAFPAADRTYQVSLTKPKRAAVFVNPYTGEIVGRYERLPFFQTMFRLHRWLLGSRPADGGIYWGKLLVGVSTLLFVFVLLSGVVIWWPRHLVASHKERVAQQPEDSHPSRLASLLVRAACGRWDVCFAPAVADGVDRTELVLRLVSGVGVWSVGSRCPSVGSCPACWHLGWVDYPYLVFSGRFVGGFSAVDRLLFVDTQAT